jgi:hypothetical protein
MPVIALSATPSIGRNLPDFFRSEPITWVDMARREIDTSDYFYTPPINRYQDFIWKNDIELPYFRKILSTGTKVLIKLGGNKEMGVIERFTGSDYYYVIVNGRVILGHLGTNMFLFSSLEEIE